jgi:15-cis-phytoene synthase
VNKANENPAPRPLGQAVIDAAKAGEPDRYLAALLAPEPPRQALLVLAAFAAEVARIAWAVREPAMGEIRLHWWRDALDAPAELSTGSEVADAARSIARSDAQLATLLHAMIDGHAAQLGAQGFLGEDAFWEFVWKTEGAQFAAAAHVLSGSGEAVARAARTAGEAYGVARIMFTLPRSLAVGRLPLPQSRLTSGELSPEALRTGAGGAKLALLTRNLSDQASANLQSARRRVRKLPPAATAAFLPLALVRPYLRAAEASASGGFHSEPRIVPFGRVLRIAAAHWGVGI